MKFNHMITKALAVALIASASMTAVYAKELPVLTLKAAVESAVNTDSDIAVYEKQIKASDEVARDTPDIASTTYRQQNLYKMKYAQDISYRKDATAHKATTLYNEIALLKEQIAFSEKAIAFKEKKLQESEIKYKKGVISQAAYQKACDEIEQAKSDKAKQETQLEADRVAFNTLAKYDINYYTLEKNFEAEPYKYVGDVQRHFRESMDDICRYDLEIAEVAADNIWYDTMGYGNAFQASSYYSAKASSAATLNSIEERKKSGVSALNTIYTNLLTTQQKVLDLQASIKQKETELKTLQVKYEKGYASPMQIEEVEIAIEQMKLDIIAANVSINQAKEVIRKPWVNFY